MPKTIDYPRTSYMGAWEVAEVVDDTGGKCAIETAARKLNRKVSGSFKAIIGSAVKFGLLTSKREFLTTTNLFRRIKHAYDKQEELIYHREAFLHPPLFNQICRKFRNRELPVHMFDVMLIREFGVEEINAQTVAKAFIDGARMAGIMDERNVLADIDLLAAQQAPRRELASGEMPSNLFRATGVSNNSASSAGRSTTPDEDADLSTTRGLSPVTSFIPPVPTPARTIDAVSSLFGLDTDDLEETIPDFTTPHTAPVIPQATQVATSGPEAVFTTRIPPRPGSISDVPAPAYQTMGATASEVVSTSQMGSEPTTSYSIRIQGPGIDTQLRVDELDDLDVVEVLIKQIRRRLSA
ncbi:hypothetical protein ACFPAF_06805 [Hymenobacter endophyticus]|uniref:Uncharacterized protein n=1 Tax=Hymenobacter endophyticus TaxID=3076335 RepID=A0ABU3TFG3_9BACT|nr:hypothetical protein [Hymenobacter endophyticus]MDU0370094.1 hypothetical protein [Hymenobacter endophyticus]